MTDSPFPAAALQAAVTAAQQSGMVVEVTTWTFRIVPAAIQGVSSMVSVEPVPAGGAGGEQPNVEPEPEPAAGGAGNGSGGRPSRRAGRPDLYDWGAIMTYVDGLVSADGVPGKMADLARMVTAWCEAQGWRYIPSERRLVERLNERLRDVQRRALERGGGAV